MQHLIDIMDLSLAEIDELIEKAKAEFKQRLGSDSYQCLIPSDVKPHLID